jgi:hypothetical protein
LARAVATRHSLTAGSASIKVPSTAGFNVLL